MRKIVSEVTTVTLTLEASDVASLIERSGLKPEGWEYFSIAITGTGKAGDIVEIKMEKSENKTPL